MALSAKERRRLMSRANRLPVVATIAARELSEAGELAEAAVEHVRACLAQHELAKVRLSAPDRHAFRRAAEALAARVPCELVGRVGRVVVLILPPDRYSDALVPRTD